ENSSDGEISYLDENNSQQWLKYYLSKLADSDGEPTGQVMVLQDISQLKNTLNATFDSVTEMIQVFKAKRNKLGEIVDLEWILNNKSSEKVYGDVIGKSLLENNPNVVQAGIFKNFVKVIQTGKPMHYEVRYKGEQFDGWFHQTAVKLGDGVATTTTDITHRRKQQEQLESSHKLLTQSETTAQTGGWELDLETGELIGSPGFYALFNLNPNTKVTPDIFIEKSSLGSRKSATRFAQNLFTTAVPQEISLVFYIDGQRKIHLIKTVYEEKDGDLFKIYGVNMDISKMHALETKNKQLTKISYKLKEKQRLERITFTLNAQEEERARFAESLHHGISQSLFAVLLKLGELPGANETEWTGVHKKIREQAQSMLKDAINETRSISHQLSPTILQHYGLKIALEDMFKKLSGTISASTSISEMPAGTNLFYQTFIYRSIQ
ncbi:MAG: hypothetical protein EOO96_25585, partial [Pedobacter sp.]